MQRLRHAPAAVLRCSPEVPSSDFLCACQGGPTGLFYIERPVFDVDVELHYPNVAMVCLMADVLDVVFRLDVVFSGFVLRDGLGIQFRVSVFELGCGFEVVE